MTSCKPTCKISVSVGELFDKYSILHIKKEKINNEEKLLYINKEIEYLKPLINDYNLDENIFKKLKKSTKHYGILKIILESKKQKMNLIVNLYC